MAEAYKHVDFSRIRSNIPIPNLLHVQRESYRQFLQMDLLPEERKNVGLQAVFQSVFPFYNFKETMLIDFSHYTLGDWQCRCGHLQGLHHLRFPCYKCGQTVRITDYQKNTVVCEHCGTLNPYEPPICPNCQYPVDLQLPFTPQECAERGLTYAAPLRVTFNLHIYDKDKKEKEVKSEEIYFGDIPLMTETGTFVVNGIERVIVSQLHRSPGVFFTMEGPFHFMAKIIPYRGSWVEFEFDRKGILYVRIDRRRKIIGTVFIRALGLNTDEDIIRHFYLPIKAKVVTDGVELTFGREVLEQEKIREKANQLMGRVSTTRILAGIRWTKERLQKLEKGEELTEKVAFSHLKDARFVHDVVNIQTGEVIYEANEIVPSNFVNELQKHNITEFEVFFPNWDLATDVLANTLEKDITSTQEEALFEFFKRMRPGEPPTLDSAKSLFHNMFFNERRYDFSRVGRFKLNIKLNLKTDINDPILHPEDYYHIVEYLVRLRKDVGHVDDIDNLGNRRVRPVGELLENHFRVGMVRLERAVKEKMSVLKETHKIMPRDVVNTKPVVAAVKEFFGSSELSQFMDQTNPLAEITHKRRLSAMGPGGLSRERAGFEVRDIHATHYGRICPIETPEGPNIGLISSLATYARINEFGFLETPYKKVEKGRVLNHIQITQPGDTAFKLNQVVLEEAFIHENQRVSEKGGKPAEGVPYAFYLSAWEEARYVIAQANVPLDEEGYILNPQVIARYGGEFITIEREKVDYIDVSPKQLVSVAASLIPFLQHDDANRALMGANMQRQAVPLMVSESPIVKTGMEEMVARDSGAVVICQRSGVVERVDAERIIVRVEGLDEQTGEVKDFGADVYPLVKYKRSNQNTCINQIPLVTKGQKVQVGQVLADGPATSRGELALGKNVMVAYMPWRGYNYEDAILINERLVKEDAFTSIHIEEFECEARDTKLGPEEITRDIPNVGDAALRDLDESGIVRIGAKVKTGDILVGKVTPKGETQLFPEEKLLRAIFGEKAGDVKDASLKVPPGIEGTVVGVRLFYRKNQEKDKRALRIEEEFKEKMERNYKDQERIFIEERNKKIFLLLRLLAPTQDIVDSKGKVILPKGEPFNLQAISQMDGKILSNLPIKDRTIKTEVKNLVQNTAIKLEIAKKGAQEKLKNLHSGEELPPGVIKKVIVYIAMKRKLAVGDKMAGRHGNKGVISKIVPEEDMPFLPDGTPIDIVLNPLGVPSRMNIGQILETHLGWAGKALGIQFCTPVFDGATEKDIRKFLKQANLPENGRTILYDGKTGEPFDQKVTVGVIYMMKLVHMVDDKIHARSIGPYSLITQQPLGGKAQFGGQRLGEMEVWALEAYGAAYTLKELLTYKSDDVEGRTKLYESIVKNKVPQDPGIPESFNVLVRELRSLCLDVELLKV